VVQHPAQGALIGRHGGEISRQLLHDGTCLFQWLAGFGRSAGFPEQTAQVAMRARQILPVRRNAWKVVHETLCLLQRGTERLLALDDSPCLPEEAAVVSP